jgi:hypothetical protein
LDLKVWLKEGKQNFTKQDKDMTKACVYPDDYGCQAYGPNGMERTLAMEMTVDELMMGVCLAGDH